MCYLFRTQSGLPMFTISHFLPVSLFGSLSNVTIDTVWITCHPGYEVGRQLPLPQDPPPTLLRHVLPRRAMREGRPWHHSLSHLMGNASQERYPPDLPRGTGGGHARGKQPFMVQPC